MDIFYPWRGRVEVCPDVYTWPIVVVIVESRLVIYINVAVWPVYLSCLDWCPAAALCLYVEVIFDNRAELESVFFFWVAIAAYEM